MDNVHLFEILRRKGVIRLYHANTVTTSCTFLENGALLSRKYVEDNHLAQTEQYSDAHDKGLGIWNDVFMDGVDIHQRSLGANNYGPVLFVLDTECLLKDARFNNRIRLAKSNPVHWHVGQEHSEMYYTTPREVEADYNYGDFKSLLFRTDDGVIELQPYLREILLDDPRCRMDGTDVFDTARAALLEAASRKGLAEVPIRRRECRAECRCARDYKRHWARVAERFRS